MKIVIDAGHGFETQGKQTVDGMKEYEFNRAVANEVKKRLEQLENVTIIFSHSDHRDVPLRDRIDKANQAKASAFVSIHANAHGDGRRWTSASGIETYIHTSKPAKAYLLANQVQANLIDFTSRKDRGIKTANFQVLRETKMTAILCECGFMTNKEEASLLKSDKYRSACSKAIVNGIISAYRLKK